MLLVLLVTLTRIHPARCPGHGSAQPVVVETRDWLKPGTSCLRFAWRCEHSFAHYTSMRHRSAPKPTVSHEEKVGDAVSLVFSGTSHRKAQTMTGVKKSTTARYLHVAPSTLDGRAARPCFCMHNIKLY